MRGKDFHRYSREKRFEHQIQNLCSIEFLKLFMQYFIYIEGISNAEREKMVSTACGTGF